MASSTVPRAIRRYTATSRVWPRRNARSWACRSRAGVQSGSTMTTLLAAVRVMPSAPAPVDSRKTKVDEWGLLKAATLRARSAAGVVPSRRSCTNDPDSHASSKLSMRVEREKMRT